jgi:hypothetical protein
VCRGPERSPPWVVAKMTRSDNGLLGEGWLGVGYCINGGVPSSTLLAMVQGSHGEPWWRACAAWWRLVSPSTLDGAGP